MSSPRILITNDDGIHAAGLEALEAIAREISDDVWVVAPESEQSGAGHSLTLHTPLRIRQAEERRYAVSGTPTDCVLMGVNVILPDGVRPDLVLSGVNYGSNVADDVTYSGTVAAAMEATLLGIPAMALSQYFPDMGEPRWDISREHAPGLIRDLLAIGWEKNTLLNLNFPDVAPADVAGIRFTAMGKRKLGDKIVKCTDPKGRPYYWIGAERDESLASHHGSDLHMVSNGYISVTPLCLDLTDYKQLEHIREQWEEIHHA